MANPYIKLCLSMFRKTHKDMLVKGTYTEKDFETQSELTQNLIEKYVCNHPEEFKHQATKEAI